MDHRLRNIKYPCKCKFAKSTGKRFPLKLDGPFMSKFVNGIALGIRTVLANEYVIIFDGQSECYYIEHSAQIMVS